METLIAPFFNVIALLAVLVFLLRKPLAEFVVNRHNLVRQELLEAREALATARKGSEQLALRLATLDSEVASLWSSARDEGTKVKGSIIAGATSLAKTIVADAASSAKGLQHEFRNELRIELAERALFRAESRLRDRLTGEDRARIRNEFSSLVEKVQ